MEVNGTLISGNNIHTKQHGKFSLDERPIKNEIKKEVKEQIDNSNLEDKISNIKAEIANIYSVFNDSIIYEEDVAIYGNSRYLTLDEYNTITEAVIYASLPNRDGKCPCAIIQKYLDPTTFVYTFVQEYIKNNDDFPQDITSHVEFIIINGIDIYGSEVDSCSMIVGLAPNNRSNDHYSYVITIDI